MFKIYVFSIGGFSSLIWYHLYYSYCNSKWVIFFRSFVEAAWKWTSRIEGHEWVALQGWCLHCWNITWGRSQTAWIYKTPKTMVKKTRIKNLDEESKKENLQATIQVWNTISSKSHPILTSPHLHPNFTRTSHKAYTNPIRNLPEPFKISTAQVVRKTHQKYP